MAIVNKASLRLVSIDRPARFAHKMFGMPFHDVIRNRANLLETHSFVESLRSPIKRRDAKEHIRMFAKDSLFDMFDKHRSNAMIPRFGHYT